MPIVRKSHPGDARQLARLAEQTFRDTFGAVNTAEHMDAHCRQNYSEATQSRELSDPDIVTVVSEEEGELVGFAQVRWSDAPACVRGSAPGEIQRLYVAKAWHGTGIAHDLMETCLDTLRKRGSDVVWLGVWEHNPRAISFYKKFGFTEVGEHVFALGGDPQRDIVMVRTA